MTTLAIIGHQGFVGEAVAAAAQKRGHDVRRVDLPRISATRASISRSVNTWRLEDPDRWALLVADLSGVDAVVNAAGAATPDSDDDTVLWSSNALLPAIVGHAASVAGAGRLVHISSAAVNGDQPILVESTPVSPESPYATSKAEGEAGLRDEAVELPPSVVIYRPTSVMGVGRPMTEKLAEAFSRVLPSGGSETPLPLALVENVGDAAVFLATCDAPPKVVTHPDEGITIGRLTAIAGGRQIPMPRPVARGAVSALRKLESRRPATAGLRRRLQLLLEGQTVEARALDDLGWTAPVGIEGYRELFGGDQSDDTIRIAYLITRSDTVAGAQVHVRDLSEAMAIAGNSVRVLVGGDGPFVDQVRQRGVEVVTIPHLERELGYSDLKALIEIRRALKEFRPDLISCHSSKAGILGRLAGRSLSVPTIFTAHGWAFAEGVPPREQQIFTGIERVMAPLATKLISVSHQDKDLAISKRVGREGQHITIHNAVHDVTPDLIARPEVDPPTIVSIARLDEQKDHRLLFQALAGLETIPQTLLVGDGPKRAELQAEADRLGIADSVSFLGLRHDVSEILARAQIFVLASNWEGLPRSIIEALRAGLPVIASAVGGVSELVDNDVNGFLVPQGDLSSLRAALESLNTNVDVRARMGIESRRRFVGGFAFPRVLRETTGAYSAALGRKVAY